MVFKILYTLTIKYSRILATWPNVLIQSDMLCNTEQLKAFQVKQLMHMVY